MEITADLIDGILRENLPKSGDAYRDVALGKGVYSYTPATGDVTDSTQLIDNLKGIFADFSMTVTRASNRKEDNSDIRSTDKKLIMIASLLDGYSPVPDQDYIIDKTTMLSYGIVGINTDPFGVLYIFHIRPESDMEL